MITQRYAMFTKTGLMMVALSLAAPGSHRGEYDKSGPSQDPVSPGIVSLPSEFESESTSYCDGESDEWTKLEPEAGQRQALVSANQTGRALSSKARGKLSARRNCNLKSKDLFLVAQCFQEELATQNQARLKKEAHGEYDQYRTLSERAVYVKEMLERAIEEAKELFQEQQQELAILNNRAAGNAAVVQELAKIDASYALIVKEQDELEANRKVLQEKITEMQEHMEQLREVLDSDDFYAVKGNFVITAEKGLEFLAKKRNDIVRIVQQLDNKVRDRQANWTRSANFVAHKRGELQGALSIAESESRNATALEQERRDRAESETKSAAALEQERRDRATEVAETERRSAAALEQERRDRAAEGAESERRALGRTQEEQIKEVLFQEHLERSLLEQKEDGEWSEGIKKEQTREKEKILNEQKIAKALDRIEREAKAREAAADTANNISLALTVATFALDCAIAAPVGEYFKGAAKASKFAKEAVKWSSAAKKLNLEKWGPRLVRGAVGGTMGVVGVAARSAIKKNAQASSNAGNSSASSSSSSDKK